MTPWMMLVGGVGATVVVGIVLFVIMGRQMLRREVRRFGMDLDEMSRQQQMAFMKVQTDENMRWLRRRLRVRTARDTAVQAPKELTYLLHFLLPAKDRIQTIGDLEEEYRFIARRYTKRRADVWFVGNAARSLASLGIYALLVKCALGLKALINR